MTTVQDIIEIQAIVTAIGTQNVSESFDKSEFEKIASEAALTSDENRIFCGFILGCFYAAYGRTPISNREYNTFIDKLEAMDIDTEDLLGVFRDSQINGCLENLTKAGYAGYVMYPIYVQIHQSIIDGL